MKEEIAKRITSLRFQHHFNFLIIDRIIRQNINILFTSTAPEFKKKKKHFIPIMLGISIQEILLKENFAYLL